MNCCKPESMGTQGYNKMLKRIQVLEGGRDPAKEARNWIIEGLKRRINKFEMEGFYGARRIVESAKGRV